MIKTITYQSSKISYRVFGEGATVVLLHGFGEDGEIWKSQVAHLKDHFRLIVPDLPGSGKSEVISSESAVGSGQSAVGSEQLAVGSWRLAVSIEDYAEVVKAILLKEQVNSCTMIGHSMGGYITLALAEKYPQLLNAFGLFHSSAFPDSEEKKTNRIKSIAFMEKNGAYLFLKTSLPGLFRCQGDYIDNLIESGRNFTTEALIQYYHAMYNRPDRRAVLKNFPGPILFIIGVYDIAAPFREGLQQCYLPQRSHLHVLRNSAHMGMLEEKEKVNTILKNFLDGLI